MSETQKPLDAVTQVGLLAAQQAKEKIAELERRHSDMLALVERVATLRDGGQHIDPDVAGELIDEARRILGRSE